MRGVISTAILAFAAGAGTLSAQDLPSSVIAGQNSFEMSVLATGFEGPWELTWGPDDHLWVTERMAGLIRRVDPTTGETSVAIELPDVVSTAGQDGLLGLAIDPELGAGTGHDFVYTAYTYTDKTLPPVGDGKFSTLFAKIVRLSYDPETGKLSDPVDLISGLQAGGDHNSGRLRFGPDEKLYYSIGDQGNQQFSNACVPIEAQTLPTADEIAAQDYFAYQGKSLRLNLDGSIPDDNPEFNGVRSHVFTYGHRNMQGLVFAPDGTLYASEHGPKADDEVNVLRGGANYGWPHVSGFVDDMAYQDASWPDAPNCAELGFSDLQIPPGVPVVKETDWPGTAQDPLVTMFTVPSDWNFSDPVCEGMDFICWPTVAPSSLDYYPDSPDGIPGWGNALIVTTLKRGSVYLIPLSDDGVSLRGPIERYFQSENRFRDVAIGPDGQTLYVATDPGGVVEALAGGTTFEMQNPGAILTFTFVPEG
ncbi:MAG: glucose/sorbosone family PQQ-dependent dehydrogenase [Marinosulfonomonas sp.]